MAIRSGLASQVGWAKETTYGTAVTVTKFLPVRNFAFKKVKNTAQGSGIFSGDFLDRGALRDVTTIGATLSWDMEVLNKDMGLFVQALMGTTVTPAIQGAGPAYLQTHTLADPFGKSLTMQGGVPDLTGTVRPYTFTGVKVISAEFTMTPGEMFSVKFTADAQDVTEATGLASVSYPTALDTFDATGGAANVGLAIKTGTFGSEASVDGVSSVTVTITRPSKVDRNNLGNGGKKSEPVLNDKSGAITGTITAEFLDKTKFADLYASDTPTSIVLEALGTLLNATFYYTFRITLPQNYFEGDTPEVGGSDVVSGDFPFTSLYDGTNQPKIEIIEVATTL